MPIYQKIVLNARKRKRTIRRDPLRASMAGHSARFWATRSQQLAEPQQPRLATASQQTQTSLDPVPGNSARAPEPRMCPRVVPGLSAPRSLHGRLLCSNFSSYNLSIVRHDVT